MQDDSSISSARPLRSRATTDGLDRAPHRAFLRAMGLNDEAIAQPFIGVVSTAGEITPCNLTLATQAAAAKAGVAKAGGTPREFTTISVSDGLSMNHQGMKFSLVSRELIADSIETVVRAHCYDGLVGFAGCDKTLPGVMMGMVRCNVPSVFVYGGSALPGRWRGRDLTILDSYEAIGAVLAGTMPLQELEGVGGTLALVQNGDTIRIDAEAGSMNVVLSDQELAARRTRWRPAAAPSLGGTLEKYAAVVGPAHLGAVTHSGKVNWPYLLPP